MSPFDPICIFASHPTNQPQNNPQWEVVTPMLDYRTTYRLSIFAGWMVRYENYDYENHDMDTSVFIPDPQHDWVVAGQQWEVIDTKDNYDITDRLSVFGGWIVKYENHAKKTVNAAFVPDPKHEWVVN